MSDVNFLADDENKTAAATTRIGIAVASYWSYGACACSDVEQVDTSYKSLPRVSPEILSTIIEGFRKGECNCAANGEDTSLPPVPAALKASNVPAESWYEFAYHVKHQHGLVLSVPTIKACFVAVLFMFLMIGSSLPMIDLFWPLALPLILAGCGLPFFIFEPFNLLVQSNGEALDMALEDVVEQWNSEFEPHGWKIVYHHPLTGSWAWLNMERRMRVLELVPTTTKMVTAQAV